MIELRTILLAWLLAGISINTIAETRTELGTKTIRLPKPATEGTVSLEKAIAARRSVRDYADKPLTTAQVSQLLWAGQGITEPRRGLRAAPSAGACYPMSLYLVAGRVEGLEPGIYLYSPSGHLLQKKSSGDCRPGLSKAALGQVCVGQAPAALALAADYGRIKPRYGDRSVRYTDMEAGHIGQNISLQAVAMGLGSVMVGAFDDSAVKQVLGLPQEESPLYIIPVGRPAK